MCTVRLQLRCDSLPFLDEQEGKAHVEDLVFPQKVCGKLRKGIEIVHIDIFREPFLGWTLREMVVEAV